MFKINKKVFYCCIGALSGASLACLIGSFNGDTVNEGFNNASKSYNSNITFSNDIVGVYFIDDKAIIIPDKYFTITIYDNEGNMKLLDRFDDLVVFSGDDKMSAYENAYSFASNFVSDNDFIYDYEDIVSVNDFENKKLVLN